MATDGPVLDVVTESLVELYERLGALDDGAVADYIPQLALADPDTFGLSLVSMDGHRYQAGDAEMPFTVQSVSKPFVYALVLSEFGLEEVTRWVGTEPSGEGYNAISLEPDTGRPDNAMINAGAIATTALVPGATCEERFERILDCLSRFAGRGLDVDEAVHRSEAETGDRNRALAYLMSSAGALPGAPSVVDTYFRQCAVRVTTGDLAVMAATLANGGVNPVTGETVVSETVACQVLAVMASCGMYDASGAWLLRVGLPAKSGVSGGLIAVSPARFGVAVHSPPLDASGTPVRGVAALRELSERFGLHMMRHPTRSAPTVTEADRGVRQGLVAVQGALDFTAAERLLHGLSDVTPQDGGWVVLDLLDVTSMDTSGATMVATALARLEEEGHRVAVVVEPRATAGAALTPWRRFPSREEAVDWCENGSAGVGGTGRT
ncbi:glutaminase A [Streptomyces sp. NBC_01766]|uniref:glutaminase A n=1 Tax=Streptomyces sp. NBC_01766 TaxID=2975936 RepID=UPI002DD8E55F|nr:glutaminase A [Streptomyces sp. NBC_01766]WSC24005.1 glutaminase A [Streptomyces sp. NBC_01766]